MLEVMFRGAVWFGLLAGALSAQPVIPARPGLVSYADETYIDDRLVDEISPGHLVLMNANSVLRTGSGHAEVLLGSCAAMWIDEESSFRFVSVEPADTRIELLNGSVVVATGPIVKGTALTVLLKSAIAAIARKGAYRFDARPPGVKVLAGRTVVQSTNRRIAAHDGQLLMLDTPPGIRRFDKRDRGSLENWSHGRAELLTRLSAFRTGNVQDPQPPLTQDDMDNVKRAIEGGVSNDVSHVPLRPMPMPPSTPSVCDLAGW
jgi:hypothetical protein